MNGSPRDGSGHEYTAIFGRPKANGEYSTVLTHSKVIYSLVCV